MMTYDETMRAGAAEYAEVLDGMRADGWQVEFTQTGGMNAALQVTLEGGSYLLITDSDDSLSWRREDQCGWGVGYWADPDRFDEPEFDGALAYESDEKSTSIDALRGLVSAVIREGTREFAVRHAALRRRRSAG